eukprot:scaffold173308_cov18-Tisochrysis_lutea.AAC.2
MAEHGVALLLRCRMLHTSALMHGEVAVVLVVARFFSADARCSGQQDSVSWCSSAADPLLRSPCPARAQVWSFGV